MKKSALEAKVFSKRFLPAILLALALGALVAGCGSGGSAESATSETTTESTEAAPEGTESSGEGGVAAGGKSEKSGEAAAGGGAVPTEAQSLATGDIPDNQEFLLFSDKSAGYSIRYPAGWARTGNGADVTFREKGNVIHIVVRKGPMPTKATATQGLEALAKTDSSVKPEAAEEIELKGKPAVKITYAQMSGPDPVTGKRLPLTVDRYEIGKAGKVAVLDLVTPVGVDNVDAYRMISESFQWR
jgi:hypothetical protein